MNDVPRTWHKRVRKTPLKYIETAGEHSVEKRRALDWIKGEPDFRRRISGRFV